jgi:beta-glucanase (GH16 family)
MRKTLFIIPILFFVFGLKAQGQVKKYYGAEIRTNESFLYGRFEVKMKSAEASGMLISFFTFYDSPDFLTNWNEIDIEILGRYQNEVQFNAIVGKHEMHEYRQILDYNPHQDFHRYAFDWTPDYIAWSVDGKEVYKQTGEHIAKMNKPQKIMMNIWPSQFWEWTGPWQEEKLPLYAQYEYVKYYTYKNGQFDLSWEDEFDKLDNLRWSFATHSFDGNACQFDPSNAKIKDGRLILSLTKGEFDPVEEVNSAEANKGKVAIVSAVMAEANTIHVTFSGPVNRINARKENFKITGVEILKAKFAMDLINVQLITSALDKEVEYELTFTPPSGEEVQKIKIKNPTK